jgi:hypothetical protein
MQKKVLAEKHFQGKKINDKKTVTKCTQKVLTEKQFSDKKSLKIWFLAKHFSRSILSLR